MSWNKVYELTVKRTDNNGHVREIGSFWELTAYRLYLEVMKVLLQSEPEVEKSFEFIINEYKKIQNFGNTIVLKKDEEKLIISDFSPFRIFNYKKFIREYDREWNRIQAGKHEHKYLYELVTLEDKHPYEGIFSHYVMHIRDEIVRILSTLFHKDKFDKNNEYTIVVNKRNLETDNENIFYQLRVTQEKVEVMKNALKGLGKFW